MNNESLYTLTPGGKFKPRHNEIALELINTFNIKTMQDTHKMYWFNNGIYQPGGKEKIKTLLDNKYAEDINLNHTKEIIGHIERKTYTPRDQFNTDPNILNLENGYLDLTKNPRKLQPHTPNLLTTYKLPVKYNPKAKCPKIDKFLASLVNYEDIFNLYEIPAYCLLLDHRLIQKAVVIVGDESNGKTAYLDLIKAFLGEKNTCSIPLQFIGSRFYTSELFGKIANIYDDLPDYEVKETSAFKISTSGMTLLKGEHKHQDPFYFLNHAKHIFSANRLPKLAKGKTGAYARRWHLIRFPNYFAKGVEGYDPHIIDKITTPEELSGFLNKALESLKRLEKNQDYTNGMNSEEAWERWEEWSKDSEDTFLDDKTETTGNIQDYITRADAHTKYSQYCEENKLLRKGKATLYDAIRLRGTQDTNRRIEGTLTRIFNGIRWKEEEKSLEVEEI